MLRFFICEYHHEGFNQSISELIVLLVKFRLLVWLWEEWVTWPDSIGLLLFSLLHWFCWFYWSFLGELHWGLIFLNWCDFWLLVPTDWAHNFEGGSLFVRLRLLTYKAWSARSTNVLGDVGLADVATGKFLANWLTLVIVDHLRLWRVWNLWNRLVLLLNKLRRLMLFIRSGSLLRFLFQLSHCLLFRIRNESLLSDRPMLNRRAMASFASHWFLCWGMMLNLLRNTDSLSLFLLTLHVRWFFSLDRKFISSFQVHWLALTSSFWKSLYIVNYLRVKFSFQFYFELFTDLFRNWLVLACFLGFGLLALRLLLNSFLLIEFLLLFVFTWLRGQIRVTIQVLKSFVELFDNSHLLIIKQNLMVVHNLQHCLGDQEA